MQASVPTFLDSLADDLAKILRVKMITQQQISHATKVPQSTISKALNRNLKRITSDLETLRGYANILLERPNLPPAVCAAAHGFMSAGGSEAELVETISLSTRLVRGRGYAAAG